MTIEALVKDLERARDKRYQGAGLSLSDYAFNLGESVINRDERVVEIPPDLVTAVTIHFEEYGCTVTGSVAYRHVHELGFQTVNLKPDHITVGPFILEADR